MTGTSFAEGGHQFRYVPSSALVSPMVPFAFEEICGSAVPMPPSSGLWSLCIRVSCTTSRLHEPWGRRKLLQYVRGYGSDAFSKRLVPPGFPLGIRMPCALHRHTRRLTGGCCGTSSFTHLSMDRWCPTYPDYFAISTSSPAKGAVIHVHNVTYSHAQPTAFQIAPRPLYVRSFDFIACRGIPRIVAAVGRDIIVFYIGVDS